MAAVLEGCVICCGSTWHNCHLPSLVRALGGRHSPVLDASCTHVITARVNTHRFRVARERTPELPLLHPRWLWACYWSGRQVRADQYVVDFYMDALRTGTCSSLGSRDCFYRELPRFLAVEMRVKPHDGCCMASLLEIEQYDEENPDWPFVSRMLQDTTFWGPVVRNMNWVRRRALLMCLLQKQKLPGSPRRRMRACRDGPVPVLRHVVRLPPELWRLVVAFC